VIPSIHDVEPLAFASPRTALRAGRGLERSPRNMLKGSTAEEETCMDILFLSFLVLDNNQITAVLNHIGELSIGVRRAFILLNRRRQ